MKIAIVFLIFVVFLNSIESRSQGETPGKVHIPYGTHIIEHQFIIGTLEGGIMHHLTLDGNPVEMHLSGHPIRPSGYDWYKRMRRVIYLMNARYATASSTIKNSAGTSPNHGTN